MKVANVRKVNDRVADHVGLRQLMAFIYRGLVMPIGEHAVRFTNYSELQDSVSYVQKYSKRNSIDYSEDEALISLMIQDIAPHTYHNEYRPVAPDGSSFVLAYENGKSFFHKNDTDNSITLPRFRELEGNVSDLYKNCIYLFSIDDERFYLIPGLDTSLLPGYEFHENRELRYVQPQYLAFASITGYQLWFWYRNRRFCGCCGFPMKHDTKERMMYCPSCGRQEYPVLMPAVIVGITNGDKIICSKYEGRSFKQYALIAGFAEIGETIEETVHREVMEEVGLKVKNLRYYKSQPWSFSGTLLFGFFCDVDGDDTLTVDHEELSVAQWFDRDKIIGQDTDSSLTNEMMMVFAAGKEPK